MRAKFRFGLPEIILVVCVISGMIAAIAIALGLMLLIPFPWGILATVGVIALFFVISLVVGGGLLEFLAGLGGAALLLAGIFLILYSLYP